MALTKTQTALLKSLDLPKIQAAIDAQQFPDLPSDGKPTNNWRLTWFLVFLVKADGALTKSADMLAAHNEVCEALGVSGIKHSTQSNLISTINLIDELKAQFAAYRKVGFVGSGGGYRWLNGSIPLVENVERAKSPKREKPEPEKPTLIREKGKTRQKPAKPAPKYQKKVKPELTPTVVTVSLPPIGARFKTPYGSEWQVTDIASRRDGMVSFYSDQLNKGKYSHISDPWYKQLERIEA